MQKDLAAVCPKRRQLFSHQTKVTVLFHHHRLLHTVMAVNTGKTVIRNHHFIFPVPMHDPDDLKLFFMDPDPVADLQVCHGGKLV